MLKPNIKNFKTIERIVKPYKIYNLYYYRPVKGFSLDSRSLKKGEAFIALKGKFKDGHDFIGAAVDKGASLVVAEKYIPTRVKVPQFIVTDGFQALAAVVSFLRSRHKKAKVVGITGSSGKTTAKEILGYLLKSHKKILKSKGTENNIFGVAKTIFAYDNHDLIIFELGTNQQGEIQELSRITKPDIGVVTCIKPSHLEKLNTVAQIKEEKLSLFNNNPETRAVLNGSDPYLSKTKLKNKIYWFGKLKKNDLYYRITARKNNKVYFKILDKFDLALPLRFENFIDNCLAALLTAHILGFPYPSLVRRLNSFKNFPPMRMERHKIRNYLIFNDAYNANPGSFQKALAALEGFRLPKVVIAADMLELGKKSGYYHRKLAYQIVKTGCRYCFTLGIHTKATRRELKALNYKNAFHFHSHKEIADFLKKRLKNEKYLILLKGSRRMRLEKVLKFL